MRSLQFFLPLLSVGSAWVIPDQAVLSELPVSSSRTSGRIADGARRLSELIKERVAEAEDGVHNALDQAFAAATTIVTDNAEELNSAYARAWANANDGVSMILGGGELPDDDPHHPPHHPPGHGPEHPPHHGHPPYHPPDCTSNKTIYQLISESKYTTKLAELIRDDEELVEVFNRTATNITVFAPTDKAFDKIPHHAPKPSKEFIKKLLMYHVSPEFHPAPGIITAHTIPTLLKEEELATKPAAQRLSISLGFHGVTINYYVHVIAPNIFAKNGVIHGIDHIILPPPRTLSIVGLMPNEFSTLELALTKTGLLEELKETPHKGGTFFAPSNYAFKKLGFKTNAFLFSKHGEKYLKALLKYHVVHNQTLYSNAFYKADGESDTTNGGHDIAHVDLPTLLDDRSVGVDIAKWGPIIFIKINGFVHVTAADGVAKDGVLHVVSNVLIPPKRLGGKSESGAEISVEDLIERLDPFAEDTPDL